MRNPFVHLLFLVAPFLSGELGREIGSATPPRTTASASPTPRAPSDVCTAAPAPKSSPAPFASPRTHAAKPATPTARRPLPAHLFM
jgi:hypothetical protein